ncbi:VacJ family lipoprotein [uncultured Nitrospira sp.]|uniref:MlaA family lipoprotein n=1 Tax=uncultured Nitrospira sp. TaxID=157176 RepID=UPI003140B798
MKGMCMRKVAQLSLTVIMAWGLSGISHAQEAMYDYPDLSPYAATVAETPIALRAELPKKIPVKDFELKVFLDHKVPDVLWYDEKLRYSLLSQKGPAPLIFVIAGTGAGYNSEKMKVLQHAFFQAGFHVLSLSSPTHPNFIVSASSTGMPGHLLEDSQDLYRVMRLAWLEHQSDVQVTEFHLTGYSLGAAQAAFVSKLDEEQGDFHFKKVLMINPPVSLYTSTSILDDMLANNIPGVADTFPEFFDKVFHAFSEVYRKGDFVNFSGDFLYTAYQDRQPADAVMAALIGTSFRLSSANMIFTSDVFTNSGYIKPKNLVLSTTDSLTDYYKVSARVTFLDYFREMFYPFFKIRYPELTEQSLIENLSLASLEEYLKHSTKIGLLHNADDFILGEGELDYLLSVFGPRAKIYPRGGHCGNLAHHATLAYIVEYFNHLQSPQILQNNPKPAPVLATPVSFRVKEPPLTQSAPVSNGTQSPDYENYPDLRDQLNRQFLVLERRIQESQDSLEETAAMAAASEPSQTDPTLLVPSGEIPVAETGIIEPARRPIEEVVHPGERFVIDVYDPIEGFNRSIYKFNAKFDEYVFLPVVEGYEAVMPDFFEDRLSNFFSNIADLRNLLNSILQLKGEVTLNTLSRILINSTFGLGGFFDHATPLGIHQQTEDFGQTLGHYGLNPGPYLVLPIFGPSSIRDTTGLLVDSAARYFYLYTPVNFDDHLDRSSAATLVWAVDVRHDLRFRYYQTGSPFEYDLVRFLHTKVRQLEIEK